jgi:hypothetical protein
MCCSTAPFSHLDLFEWTGSSVHRGSMHVPWQDVLLQESGLTVAAPTKRA